MELTPTSEGILKMQRLGSVTLDLGHLNLGLPPLWGVPLLKMPSNKLSFILEGMCFFQMCPAFAEAKRILVNNIASKMQ